MGKMDRVESKTNAAILPIFFTRPPFRKLLMALCLSQRADRLVDCKFLSSRKVGFSASSVTQLRDPLPNFVTS